MAPPKDTGIPALPPQTVNVGRPGEVRSIEFRKLMMDKDYVWKLEFIVKGRILEVAMQYEASLICDPTTANEQLEGLYREATSKQMSMEAITGKLQGQMERIHNGYAENARIFGIVDFKSGMLKVENKPLNQQLIQLVIDNKAAQDISKLLNKLDEAAIVLYPSSRPTEEDPEEE